MLIGHCDDCGMVWFHPSLHKKTWEVCSGALGYMKFECPCCADICINLLDTDQLNRLRDDGIAIITLPPPSADE